MNDEANDNNSPADAPTEEQAPDQAAPKQSPIAKVLALPRNLLATIARSPSALKPKLHAPAASLAHKLAIPTLFLAAASIFSAVTVQAQSAEGPNFDAALDSVQDRLDASRFREALTLLNEPLGTQILTEDASDAHRGRFYAISADAVYFAQQREGIDRASNHERIADFYRTARDQYGQPLTDDQTERLARSLTAVGQTREAVDEARTIEQPRHRITLLRELIEQDLHAETPQLAQNDAFVLIRQIATGEHAIESDRLWATEWSARFLLRDGNETAAIDRLLTRIHTLEDRSSPAAARLFALLGRAYVESGHPEAARKHLEHALEHLPRTHQAAAEANVSLARVVQAAGQPQRATDRFTTVIQRFPNTGPAAIAHLGLATIASAQGNHQSANDSFNEALRYIDAGHAGSFLTRQQLINQLQDTTARLSLEQNHENALLFALTLEDTFPSPTPPEMLRSTADIHNAIAESKLKDTPRASSGLPRLDKVDPQVLEAARSHHFEAATRYRQVARRLMANLPEDAAQALWDAADNFDKAGDLKRATNAFAEYVQLRNSDDPRQVAALFRLARAHQAGANHDDAIRVYERLIEEFPTSDETYRSYVPLARSYLLLDTEDGDRAAERHLSTVVDGQIIEPDAPEFRDALIELGRLFLRTQRHDDATRYARAIQHLAAAKDRYPAVQADPELLLSLANANRLSALAIDDELQLPMRPSERDRLNTTKQQRLREAIGLYTQVAEHARDHAKRRTTDTATNDRILRDALLHHADAAYALAKHVLPDQPSEASINFQDAITHYDAVARRFPDDQIALVAMVQIVNAHVRLKNWQHARTAQRKARARLDQLPEGTLDTPASLMSRNQWEEWLDSTLHLDALAAADTSFGPR